MDFELGMASIPELTYRSNYGSVARILSNSGELSAFQEGGFNAFVCTDFRTRLMLCVQQDPIGEILCIRML